MFEKIWTIHSWGLSALNMQTHFWFVSSFEHINFAINGEYSKNVYDNPNYYASLVIFETLKNAILTPLIVFLPYCYCFGCDVDLVVLHNT